MKERTHNPMPPAAGFQLNDFSPAYLDQFVSKMQTEEMDAAIIALFCHYYRRLVVNAESYLREQEIRPVQPQDLVSYRDLEHYVDVGHGAIGQTVRIVLNGGLGTSMGLTRAKSLLEVKSGRTFLDIILSQPNQAVADLCLMNSYSTHQDTLRHLEAKAPTCRPLMFFQNKFPKVLQENLQPVAWPLNPDLEWNPPGHGDIYLSLHASGTLEKLLERGIRYAFISNADNLGATLDVALLGYLVGKKLPFLMEVAQRTRSDAKGGHLAWLDGRQLVLREIAQCAPQDRKAFQDIETHRFFNTNNIWVDLEALQKRMGGGDLMRMPLIINPKTLDPTDDGSPPVYQLETAMGAAISVFEGAAAVEVPRARFIPVKSTTDLLAVRSDIYRLEQVGAQLHFSKASRNDARIDLDQRFFGRLDQFDRRFSNGVPSLKECRSLSVQGNVHFAGDVRIQGDVEIVNHSPGASQVPVGTTLADETFVLSE